MIKLNITLGNSFFSQFYNIYTDMYGAILPKIRQHRIVLSKKLIDYYVRCAEENGCKDACTTFIQKISLTDQNSIFVQDYDAVTIEEGLSEIAMTQPKKILCAEKEEVKKARRGVNLLRGDDIINNSNCIFNLYCIPITARYVEADKPVASYVSWLGNWIKGESKLIIRDKYLLTDRGLKSFKKFFLPNIDSGAQISIHTDTLVEQRFLDEFSKSDYAQYDIRIYKCSHMHERVIILKECQIVIGKGIDFLQSGSNLTDECFITISQITIDADKYILQQIR